MSSVSDMQALMTAAVSARASGDLSTARNKAEAALGLLAIIPDGARDGTSVNWHRQGIREFLRSVERAISRNATSSGLQTSKVEYIGEDC